MPSTALQSNNLIIRPFRDHDARECRKWADSHKRAGFDPSLYPAGSGWAVLDSRNRPILYGWLLKVEGARFAFLDGLYSRPGLSANDVLRATETLVGHAEETLYNDRGEPVRALIAVTSHGAASAARRIGFKIAQTAQSVITYELNPDLW
jgi:hypothetical protein